jgi:transposase
MRTRCKHCGSEERVKNGYVGGKQRWKCKSCRKSYRERDLREKYTNEQRLRVIKWYLEGAGIMSIERMEGVPNPLIIKWIRKFSRYLGLA